MPFAVVWLRPRSRVLLDIRIQTNGWFYIQLGRLVIRRRYS